MKLYKIRIYVELEPGFQASYAAAIVRNGSTQELESGATRGEAVRVAVAKIRAARKLYGAAYAESMDQESADQREFRTHALR